MKNIFIALLTLFTTSIFAQEVKYEIVANIDLSDVLARVVSVDSTTINPHLYKTFIVNDYLGFTKEGESTAKKQSLYISDTFFGKDGITTRLYKTENLLEIEDPSVIKTKDGILVSFNHFIPEVTQEVANDEGEKEIEVVQDAETVEGFFYIK